MPTILRQLALGGAVFGAYVAAATLGFEAALVAEQVTTVWAPTGIAQAALLLWGRSLWPAVWLGAFAVNAGAEAPLWTAAAVATGNTLEAVAAAWLLSRFGFDPALRRTRDGVAFILVAAGLTTTISATIGVVTLCAAHVQPWHRFSELWWAWWLGDATGALVVAPVILTFARWQIPTTVQRWAPQVLLVFGSAVATHVVFAELFGPTGGHHPLEYVIFPFLITAAVGYGQPATALVVLGSAAVAIANTLRGSGPFADGEVHQSLVLLQVFTGVVAGTGVVLAAAIAERETSERRRAGAHAVSEVLATAGTLSQAAPEILRAICKRLDWSSGAIWVIDPVEDQLRCLDIHAHLVPADARFILVSRETRFPRGIGLPGRVWQSGKAAWIENVADDPNFPRAPLARAAGLHGAFAFPICIGNDLYGVIEFFNRSVVSPDPALLETMSTVGSQIGQFVARTQWESSVAVEQRRTRAILDTALDAIIGMDHRGIITQFNPAAERIFGYTQAAAVGRDLADLLIPVELRDAHREGLRRYLATGVGPFLDNRVQTSAYHADGHEFPVEVSITRVPEESPPRFTGFVRDQTARARAEQEREQLLHRELVARQEAETANRAKDEFLATLSHELRTPLNAIIGWTRMLLDGALDEQGRRRALDVIDRNAHLQARLVGDILDVSRIITGGLKLDVRPVDLVAVIGAALDAVRPAADARKIRIDSLLSLDAHPTTGDAARLQQVVWNLLANAVKFTQPEGVIEVELVETEQGTLRISVKDDGAGIDGAFLPHVFDRFRQADGSVSRQHGGLGLGLAIVRHLVELHGGRVRADSPGPDQGSTFTVELPVVRDAKLSIPRDKTE